MLRRSVRDAGGRPAPRPPVHPGGDARVRGVRMGVPDPRTLDDSNRSITHFSGIVPVPIGIAVTVSILGTLYGSDGEWRLGVAVRGSSRRANPRSPREQRDRPDSRLATILDSLRAGPKRDRHILSNSRTNRVERFLASISFRPAALGWETDPGIGVVPFVAGSIRYRLPFSPLAHFIPVHVPDPTVVADRGPRHVRYGPHPGDRSRSAAGPRAAPRLRAEPSVGPYNAASQ